MDILTKNPQKMTRSSAMGQSSTSVAKLDTRTSRTEKFNSWTRWLTKLDTRTSWTGKFNKWKVINALNLDIVKAKPLQEEMLVFEQKSCQRGEEMHLATLDELKQTAFPRRWSSDAQMDFHDVKSDFSSSVASSVTALKFLEFVCHDCGSSVEGDPDEDAPACSSLDLGSADDNDSVGSISSAAESAIERRMSAN